MCINIQIYLVFNTFRVFTIAYQMSLISICHLITSDGGPTDGTVYCDISRVKTNMKQIIILCLFTSTFHYYPLLLLLPLPPRPLPLSVSFPPSLLHPSPLPSSIPPSFPPSLPHSLPLCPLESQRSRHVASCCHPVPTHAISTTR